MGNGSTSLAKVSIYDTFAQRKVEICPLIPGEIRMYVCGPTVYNLFHVGNARPLVAFDVVARHLRARGYRVKFVRNITDVDDKIIARARECGEDPKAFAERWTAEYHRDFASLGCQPSDVEPRATEHIGEMIAHIEKLIAHGLAYESDGSVYYSVASFAAYGELSRLPREELLCGARKDIEPGKRDAADFALWKSAKPDEPSWPSPWGAGRPGWHIECSAMSEKYLGPTFDIHGGGIDLVFPESNRDLAGEIRQAGTLVSQFAPPAPRTRTSFLLRNHVIAALSEASLIMDGDERSGSRYEVKQALDYDRPVFAWAASLGHRQWVLDLVRAGSVHLVESADEVREHLARSSSESRA